jgi:hypothetical protein
VEHVARIVVEKCVQGFGWENLRGKPLERPGSRWENNTKMDLQEKG